eukprot:CAMPEP_0176070720 /NCGR_PEP_ID=MMETSP0120_2-20121206/35320_1 /TAXON_ID=160619 /ORGANISM="Kryptoperidinium foliaceum, Strain CCMP 1326" /LENGTH=268 /DNA_ID=CAMNT_0017404373 /DNA_START=54 /DNA_END=857 /DNA_ORIENTATION=-
MAFGAFSKVNLDDLESDDDEEAEQRRAIKSARVKYETAQNAFKKRGSSLEVLKLFEEADAAMQPALKAGMANLEPPELEMVLKGRLHQGVIFATVEHIPNRWARAKRCAEEVLQFDFGNAHARWIRASALASTSDGSKALQAEAEEEMRRAIQCARTAGKNAEADQWEEGLRNGLRASAGIPGAGAPGTAAEGAAASAPPSLASPPATAGNGAARKEAPPPAASSVGAAAAASVSASSSPPAQGAQDAQIEEPPPAAGSAGGMQRGFF